MEPALDPVEVRTLGSLIEKEMATPEYYPMSLNALVNACNQKTNRNPVTDYDDKTVARALESLIEKRLAYASSGSRVEKYGQLMSKSLNLIPAETAALCVLMLRGPQTAGEIRSRTERMHRFGSIEEVESVLSDLSDNGLLTLLEKMPGHKERRYSHLLSGAPEQQAAEPRSLASSAVGEVRAENERLKTLEEEVENLKSELQELKEAFLDFKGQFE